ncbi:hypothetical protein G9C85_13510 [Halorubellus sp. JP-L1]|uniref:toxin-antitoxin system TumE family protein n=1 Tax=Halorubellus sp. JP-L1 TaxID=2715753 RepID=UPI001407320F|nr:DUF6516 family protein [Halorubellus sp. JP-L1]NHN42639.1 hypothetical protein [Halorubellus sp. JP-L1]
MAPDDVEVSTILDRRYDFGTGVVRIRVLRVPESEKFPDGVKYAFHYGEKGGDDPHIRYDNHHGTHERHEGDRVEEVRFTGYEALLERFRREIPVALDP